MFKAMPPVKLPKTIKYLFLLIPFIEIALFIVVGKLIGVMPTVILALATSIVGLWVLKGLGVEAMLKQQSPLGNMRSPVDLMAISVHMMAGVLLLLPGFFTDTIGLLCLIPALKKAIAATFLKRSFGSFQQGMGPGGAQQTYQQNTKASNDPKVIEGEFWEEDNDKDR